MLDGPPRLSLPVPDQVGNILDDEIPGFVCPQYLYHVIDQITPLGAFQALLSAGLRKRLAREPGTQNVVIRHRGNIECPDVTMRA
jgi:hypothetical protein